METLFSQMGFSLCQDDIQLTNTSNLINLDARSGQSSVSLMTRGIIQREVSPQKLAVTSTIRGKNVCVWWSLKRAIVCQISNSSPDKYLA